MKLVALCEGNLKRLTQSAQRQTHSALICVYNGPDRLRLLWRVEQGVENNGETVL